MSKFKNKVIYQIYPKSFHDSNGDGIGDINGITGKLDYLEELGVDYLWLTPFYLSPQNDNGYDIEDYFSVDPIFGIMEDLEHLIREAGRRKIGIMTDMVLNHTSTNHEWFQKALAGDRDYMDYYYFREGGPDLMPTNWESKFGGPAWDYVPHLKQWYLHLYDKTQADLNWNNPKVREEIKAVIRFWKSKGIKGFRFDVINLISKPDQFCDDSEGDGRRFYTDGPRVHEFIRELVRDTGIEELVTVGEMSSTTIEDCIRYSNPEEAELDMCFNFHHLKIDYKNQKKWELMKPDLVALKNILQEWQYGMQSGNGWNAVFWCNHDQPRIVSRLGDDRNYWKESAKMLATLIHMLRGTPYIYQGEELGMTNAYFEDISEYRDVESLNYYQIMLNQGKTPAETLAILGERSRDNARTPLRWNEGINGGFSDREPWIPFSRHERSIVAGEQLADQDSIFHYYRRLIALRKDKTVISEGEIAFISQQDSEVIAYRRYLPEGSAGPGSNKEIVVVNNLGNGPVTADIGGDGERDLSRYRYLIGNYENSLPEGIKGTRICLRPYEAIVLEAI